MPHVGVTLLSFLHVMRKMKQFILREERVVCVRERAMSAGHVKPVTVIDEACRADSHTAEIKLS